MSVNADVDKMLSTIKQMYTPTAQHGSLLCTSFFMSNFLVQYIILKCKNR